APDDVNGAYGYASISVRQRRTASVRLWAENFRMICWMCILTVFSDRLSLAAISLLGRPSSSSASTCCSRGVKSSTLFAAASFLDPLASWMAGGPAGAGDARQDASFCVMVG